MTESINEWHFSGNAGSDAEMRYLASGRAVCDFNVAVTEHVPTTADNGDRMLRETTTWVRVTAWGPLGEALSDRVRKGAAIEAWGRPGSEAWVDKETGEVKHRVKATVRRVVVDGSEVKAAHQQRDERRERPREAPRRGSAPWPAQPPGSTDPDDLPFE